jgi:co-chaperonin GroES (HSP10)
MTVKATKRHLLIEEATTNGTFAIPTEKNDGLRLGRVISVGEWVYHNCGEKVYAPCELNDLVYFIFYGNEKVNIDNKVCYLIDFDQIRGIVTE